QQQNQGNNELLHTSSSTLCSFISATPNWTNAALIGEHLWNDTTSTETCYVDESECTEKTRVSFSDNTLCKITESINPITNDGETLGDVESLKYLGSIIDERGGSD
ncbi:unnamed protein product, partial [Schistosoma curassoni]|uniref:C-type lectin domain-containing protein n=1 Tax=Schistosoma curassoni TaxID=6186 RepID=A0A183KCT4_9TREM